MNGNTNYSGTMKFESAKKVVAFVKTTRSVKTVKTKK